MAVRYTPTATANLTQIDNIETLSHNDILLKDCLAVQQTGGVPQCILCADGRRLMGGFCWPLVAGCAEYAEQYCIRCMGGLLLSSDHAACVGTEKDERLISAAIGVALPVLH